MERTVVVDEEYQIVARSYEKMALKVNEATEYFKKNVMKILNSKAIVGKTAENMGLYLCEMTSVLRATFKEQISFEATLCKEYIQKMNTADKSKSFDQSTKEIKEMSFWEAPEKQYPEGMLIVDKTAVLAFIAQLKEGPVKDIEAHISSAGLICFDDSMGAVKDQNIAVRDKTLVSLKALLEIFNTFIDCIEGTVATMTEFDSFMAGNIGLGAFHNPGLPVAPFK